MRERIMRWKRNVWKSSTLDIMVDWGEGVGPKKIKSQTPSACTTISKINFYLRVLKIFKSWFWWICPPPANRMEVYLFFCNPEAFYKTCMALQYPPCTWNLRNTAQLVQFIFKYPKGFQTPKCRHILLTYIFVGLGSWVVYIWMHLTKASVAPDFIQRKFS